MRRLLLTPCCQQHSTTLGDKQREPGWSTVIMASYSGGCLCGAIRYALSGAPSNPHFCSCRQCQRWSGAPVVAWVDFPLKSLSFTGAGGEPAFYRSSRTSRRGHCPACGGTLCAVTDGSATVCMTIATLDDPSQIVPLSHSYPEFAPSWLNVKAVAAAD